MNTSIKRISRGIVPVLAVVVVAVVIAGCGGTPSVSSIPSDDVAIVGNVNISKKVFDHWYGITVKSQQALLQTKSKKAPTVPSPLSAKGQPFTQQTMQTLIQAASLQQEAVDLKVGGVSKKDIQKQLDQAKKQFFGGKAAKFNEFLKKSGMSLADVQFRIKLGLLSQDVVNKAAEDKDNVSDGDIQDFYKKNKQQFVTPKRYNLLVVLNKSQSAAQQAKSKIDGGESIATVAKSLSQDPASKKNGGKLEGVVEGQYGAAFDKALKSAKQGQTVGPIKTQFGYYVFQVQSSSPASTTPLDKAKAQIKKNLKLQKQTEARQKFAQKFQDDWKKKTVCRKGYIVQSCSNAPAPTNTAPPGGAPQGAPQQGAPQQGAPQQAPQQGAPQQSAPQQAPPSSAPPSGQ